MINADLNTSRCVNPYYILNNKTISKSLYSRVHCNLFLAITYLVAINVINTKYQVDVSSLIKNKMHNATYFSSDVIETDDIIFIGITSHSRDPNYLYVIGEIGGDITQIPLHTVINIIEIA
ncbi:Hypothetical protein HVR_LOCUS69 [uncultured virus]|nr:Hypothetical protein HVR_LOCUS69 [uncultured virus]